MAIYWQVSPSLEIAGPSMKTRIHAVPTHFLNELPNMPTEDAFLDEHGLVDTGASMTCIDVSIAKKLNLIPHDRILVSTPNGEAMQFLYDVSMQFPVTGKDAFWELQVLGANLGKNSHKILIGRDFLKKGILIYNGLHNKWEFCV